MLVIPRTRTLHDQKVFSFYNFNTKPIVQKMVCDFGNEIRGRRDRRTRL